MWHLWHLDFLPDIVGRNTAAFCPIFGRHRAWYPLSLPYPRLCLCSASLSLSLYPVTSFLLCSTLSHTLLSALSSLSLLCSVVRSVSLSVCLLSLASRYALAALLCSVRSLSALPLPSSFPRLWLVPLLQSSTPRARLSSPWLAVPSRQTSLFALSLPYQTRAERVVMHISCHDTLVTCP